MLRHAAITALTTLLFLSHMAIVQAVVITADTTFISPYVIRFSAGAAGFPVLIPGIDASDLDIQALRLADDLDGVTFEGQALSLDLQFANGQYVVPRLAEFDGGFGGGYDVALNIFHNSEEVLEPVDGPLVSLLDVNLEPLFPEPITEYTTAEPGSFSYGAFFAGLDVDGLAHHGVHFDLTLPQSMSPAEVTGAELVLQFGPPGFLELVTPGAVPEPTSLITWSAGVISLLACRRRQRRNTASRC